MYLVSLESSLKMEDNGVHFMLISWILFKLSWFQIWTFINFILIPCNLATLNSRILFAFPLISSDENRQTESLMFQEEKALLHHIWFEKCAPAVQADAHFNRHFNM